MRFGLGLLAILTWLLAATSPGLAAKGATLVEPVVSPALEQKTIKVGVVVAPPFLTKGADGHFGGLAYDLWTDVARDLGLHWQATEYDLEGLLGELRHGKIDVGVTALSITPERETDFDFSQPYYYTGLGIAVPAKSSMAFIDMIGHTIFSRRLLVYLASLLVLLLVVGTLVWLIERRHNPNCFRPGCRGIGDGMWWSAVTMTAVGYGDSTPKTLAGRVLGLVWMFASVALLASFTAGITSSLTVAHMGGAVSSPEDLAKVRTGVMHGSSAEEELSSMHVMVRSYDSVDDGLRALNEGFLDAFVHDQPILQYYGHKDYSGSLRVLTAFFDRQLYGFGFPRGSSLRKVVNVVMLRRLEDYDYRSRLFGPYFGPSAAR